MDDIEPTSHDDEFETEARAWLAEQESKEKLQEQIKMRLFANEPLVTSLRKRGLDDADINSVFHDAAMARLKEPTQKPETRTETRQRLAPVIRDMRKLSQRMDQHAETCFTGLEELGCPLSEFLLQIADAVEAGIMNSSRPISSPSQFRTFLIRKVCRAIKKFTPLPTSSDREGYHKKRAPNEETATIVSILLDDMKITANDVCQAMKDERRRYD